jgi:hypothetical protein
MRWIITDIACCYESHALKFGSQKLNLHLSGHEFEPKASKVQPGSEDLCFITQHPIDDVLSAWKSASIEVSIPTICRFRLSYTNLTRNRS